MKIRNRRNWMSLVISAVLLACVFSEPLLSQEPGEPISGETSATETSVPKAAEPETPALKAAGPETPVPKAPESEAPAPKTPESEAPAPKAAEPETSAPKAAEPETPAPKAAEPETPAPKAAEPETPAPKAAEPEAPASVPAGGTASQPTVNAAVEAAGNASETVPEKTADADTAEPEKPVQTQGQEYAQAAAEKDNSEEASSETAAEADSPTDTETSSEAVTEDSATEKETAADTLAEDESETSQEEAAESFEGEGGEEGEDGKDQKDGKDKKDGEDGKDDEDDEDSSPCLSGVSVGEDFDGAYLYYVFKRKDKPAVITVSLVDGSGNMVGRSVSANVTGDRTEKSYLLPLSGSPYGLSLSDMGKAVSARITAESESGNEEVFSESSLTLRTPSQIMPAYISFTAVSSFGDLMNPATVSGSAFDPGSFGTSRTVEKMAGGSWEAKDPGAALTAADGGTYRIHIVTCLGDFYSNEFKVVVPAVGITVEGEQRIGNTLTAKAQGENGSVPEVDAYEWFYKEGSPVGSSAVYTASLKDAAEAQSLTLNVRITDQLGNKYTQVMTLAPLDLATVSLILSGYEELTYNEGSQIPMDGQILLGDYVIPRSLYSTGPASGKNTVNAGSAWMTVTGNSAYLTGASDVEYLIGKEDPDVDEDDFITSFTYDGKAHQPVLDKDAGIDGKLKYKRWQRKNSNGTWTDIPGAPVDGGTYRVTVTLKSADGNYKKAVFRKMEFTITGGAEPETETDPAPEAAPADLTVTDAAGNPAGYRSKDILVAAEDGQEALHALEISADPVKLSDGNVQVDAFGKAVYRQRNLHITPALVADMQSRQNTMIRFVLGEAGIQFPVSVLHTGTAYTVKLALLEEADLTDGEKNVLSGYGTTSGFYAFSICRENDGTDVTEQFAPEVMLEVKPDDAAEPADILFLMENRKSAQTKLAPDLAGGQAVRQEDKVYLKRTVQGSGIFGLLR